MSKASKVYPVWEQECEQENSRYSSLLRSPERLAGIWPRAAFQPGSWEVPQSRGLECDLVLDQSQVRTWRRAQILPYFCIKVIRMSLRTMLSLTENKTSGRIFIVRSSGMLELQTSPFVSLIIYFYTWGKIQGATDIQILSDFLFICQFSPLLS